MWTGAYFTEGDIPGIPDCYGEWWTGGRGAERGSQGGGESLWTHRESRYEWTSHSGVKMAGWVTGWGRKRLAAGEFPLALYMFILLCTKYKQLENLFLQEEVCSVALSGNLKRSSSFHMSSELVALLWTSDDYSRFKSMSSTANGSSIC